MSAQFNDRRCTCQLCVPEWAGWNRRVDVPAVPENPTPSWSGDPVVIVADDLPVVEGLESPQPVHGSSARVSTSRPSYQRQTASKR